MYGALLSTAAYTATASAPTQPPVHRVRPTEDGLYLISIARVLGDYDTAVEDIRPDLIIPTGKRKGQHPSVAGIYRALAEHGRNHPSPEVSHIRPKFPEYYGTPVAAAAARVPGSGVTGRCGAGRGRRPRS
ncbi:hypothetical protein [Saccharothrix lopnurensis]|uniref:Uncharacterized protein n=1 Tax=Saccharothrix lopnurensis TaxID=1670621 RepID=A0ABW1P2G2_9PSEU